jgi:hypothetical protein
MKQPGWSTKKDQQAAMNIRRGKAHEHAGVRLQSTYSTWLPWRGLCVQNRLEIQE